MNKIGIVSELNMKNVNYGNRLQAFALNYYINNHKKIYADSLIFSKPYDKKVTNKYLISYVKIFINNCLKIFNNSNDNYFKKRLENCNNFTLNTTKTKIINNYRDLKKEKYDIYIVGSDVVWAQFNNAVNRIKFLDFSINNDYKRIAYSASFGKNLIPNENKKYIRDELNKFCYISVREHSSIKILEDIGVKNVFHTCDPTLLLSKEEWTKIMNPIKSISRKSYIFTYLLGKSKEQRKEIENFAKKEGCLIVTIPNANMKIDDLDKNFGDILIDDCSPEQWLWLISNATYVITDSFHGCVFSTIFNKKFIVLKRDYSTNINIRMEDYLDSIGQSDKFLSSLEFENKVDNLNWDYNIINKKIDEFVKKSKEFLEKALDIK